MAGFLRDLLLAVRSLRKSPGFTSVAVLTLALGIGVNTAIFSVVNAVLVSPLPFPDAERLVRLWGTYRPLSLDHANVNPLDAEDWAREDRALSALALFQQRESAWTGQGEPSVVTEARVSAGFFALLGVPPVVGRSFATGEDVPGRDGVVVVSHAFWRARLGGDSSVLSRTLTIRGQPVRVIGVLPPLFRRPVITGPNEPELYRPLALDLAAVGRGGHFLSAIARLAPGASLASAQSALRLVSSSLEKDHPETNTGWSLRAEGLRDSLAGGNRRTLLLLLGAVGFVLLIACVNVSGLLLARGVSRRKEAAIRVALGASRGRLVSQLLAESLVLSFAGGVLGVLVGGAGTKALARLVTDPALRVGAARVDATVLLVSLGLAAIAGLLAGLLPAIQYARVDPLPGLKGESAGMRRRISMADRLVVLEVALALGLLVGAGLITKSLWLLYRVDPGFSPESTLAFEIALPDARYAKADDQRAFFRELLAGLASLPGVVRASAVNIMPLGGGYSCDGFTLEDRAEPPLGQLPCAESRVASPDYFAAMRIPVKEGAPFDARDDETAPRVAVITETMARKYWPGASPVGKRLKWGNATEEPWRTIVGVVGEIRHKGLDVPPDPEVYVPLAQVPQAGMTVVLRIAVEPRSLYGPVRSEVARLDPLLPLQRVRTMKEQLDASISSPRLRALLFGLFAALGVVLSAVGLFGVVGQSVRERTREFGIRIALGAQTTDVIAMVLRRGACLVGVGLAGGLFAALLLSRFLTTVLFEVTPLDPIVFLGVTLLLASVAALACWLPARAVTKVDPVTALRAE